MNIQEIKRMSEHIADDSIIKFKDGTTVKGAMGVSAIIIQCCEDYNNGYLEGMNDRNEVFTKNINLGFIVGIGAFLTTLHLIKKRNSKKTRK